MEAAVSLSLPKLGEHRYLVERGELEPIVEALLVAGWRAESLPQYGMIETDAPARPFGLAYDRAQAREKQC